MSVDAGIISDAARTKYEHRVLASCAWEAGGSHAAAADPPLGKRQACKHTQWVICCRTFTGCVARVGVRLYNAAHLGVAFIIHREHAGCFDFCMLSTAEALLPAS